jgi:hypothetical protein
VRRRTTCLALALACLSSNAARADSPTLFKEGRIGAGADVIHAAGTPLAAVSLYPVSLYAWSHNFGAGLTWEIGKREGWNGGLGGIVVRNTDEDLGTNLNFLLRASYCGRKLCLSFSHISHGGVIGIRPDSDNYGLNFLFLEYRYR